MEPGQAKQIFQSLKHDSEAEVISTGRFLTSFVDSIRHSPLDSNQEIDQIVACFDPDNSGFITFDNFERGIEQLLLNQHSAMTSTVVAACVESPVEDSPSRPSIPGEATRAASDDDDQHFLSPQSLLLSFDSAIDSFSPEPAVNPPPSSEESTSTVPKYSDDLAELECLSVPSWTDTADEMSSLVENKANNDFSQMEEHFEFTPSPENALSKKHDDDGDEDFSFTNGDNSYNSMKSVATFNTRNTWMRSSVRRNGGSLKRNSSIGPYASSPIYRKSPTNDATSLSRRSSLSYESDEMNNDANLEEDVQNLNDKLKKLQEQIELLTEAQMKNEIKYSSMKRENLNLNDKISFLEEQIRDIELQSDERKVEDERRFKESMARLEREKSQELENYVNRIFALQTELFEAKEEVKRHQQTIDNLHNTKSELDSQVQEKELEIESLNEEIAKLKDVIRKQSEESRANSTLIEALNNELATNRQTSDLKRMEHHRMQHESEMNNINVELESQLRFLKEENRTLKESNEELTAQLLNNHLMEGKSLLKEGEAISSLANEISDLNIEQLKTTLKEQQDVNAKLRSYIDGILLNIVENYPQLLEVKRN